MQEHTDEFVRNVGLGPSGRGSELGRGVPHSSPPRSQSTRTPSALSEGTKLEIQDAAEIVFDFGDCRSIQLDAEPREFSRQLVLGKRRAEASPSLWYASARNVPPFRTLGHTGSVPSRIAVWCSKIERMISGMVKAKGRASAALGVAVQEAIPRADARKCADVQPRSTELLSLWKSDCGFDCLDGNSPSVWAICHGVQGRRSWYLRSLGIRPETLRRVSPQRRPCANWRIAQGLWCWSPCAVVSDFLDCGRAFMEDAPQRAEAGAV